MDSRAVDVRTRAARRTAGLVGFVQGERRRRSEHSSLAWLQPKAGTYLPTELAYGGGLYVLTHTGILTRFDAKTGVQAYKARVGGGGDFTSSPWGYNGKVFCINEEGRTFVIRAGDKYEELDSNDLDEMALATPALIGDRLILRTDKHLYSIRNTRGNKVP